MAGLKVLLLVIAYATIVYASRNNKAPPPAANGCYKGRSDGSINAQAVFDMGGVTGYVQFYQPSKGEPTQVNVNLGGLEQFTGFYPWHAHEYPVRNALLRDFPCSIEEVGGHYDPNDALSDPDYATNCRTDNREACEIGGFTGKLGTLRNDQVEQSFVDDTLDLYGPQSVVGRALVIHYPQEPHNRFICANIEPIGCNVKNLRAAFDNGVLQGDVVIRYASGQDTAKIFVNLHQFGVDDTDIGNKTWTLHAGRAGIGNTCDNVMDEIDGFGGNAEHFADCAIDNHRGCAYGDLTTKCGPLLLRNTDVRFCCTDAQIGLIPFDTLYMPSNNRFLSIRIMDEDIVEGCATFEKVAPQVGKAHLNSKNIFGTVYFTQSSPLDRTFIQANLGSIRMRDVVLTIHENAVEDTSNCSDAALGPIFAKPGGQVYARPLGSNGVKTGDAGVIGNLGSAIPITAGSQRVSSRTSSHYVPVFGPFSVIGRSLVLTETTADGLVNLACGTITRQSIYPSGRYESINGYQNIDRANA